ncbi:MAG: hypothetical protein ABI411_12820 [Tahibacter sp.]
MKSFCACFVMALAAAASLPSAVAAESPAPAQTASAPAAPRLHAALRELWQGHVAQTRAYAVAVKAGDAKTANAAADGVVANATSIAGAVGGFYGKPAGDRMLQLLAGHWGAVKAMTDARHANDDAGYTAAMQTLTANVDEIAKFLSGANPNLPEDAVRGLLLAHGAHHAAQIQQLMQSDAAAESATWAAMKQHMDVIADTLAGAIAKQFPDKAT